MPVFFRIISLLLAALLVLYAFRGRNQPARHARYRKKALQIASRLRESDLSDSQALAYLRKINPYVFEEMVLDAFVRDGYKAVRSSSYSGDGGVDGRLKKDEETFLVQCKRYRKHISKRHFEDFVNLCDKCHKKGFSSIPEGQARTSEKKPAKEALLRLSAGRSWLS